MAIYWADTSVLTQANRGSLAFDISPSFWLWLEEQIKAEALRSPILVKDEIDRGDDELKVWSAKMEAHGLYVFPDPNVIAEFAPIADYVHTQCNRAEGDGFLDDADTWVIAHAKATQGTPGIVITEEVAVSAESKKIRIPNVCERFGVEWINTVEFLRRRKFKR